MKKTNVPGSQSFGQKLLQFIRNNTVPIMFILICAYCIPQAGFSWSYLLNEVMTRLGRNAFLILSLLIPVMAGMGMNFGMTLGAMAGEIGLIFAADWQVWGIPGMILAAIVSIPISVALGVMIGKILNRSKGLGENDPDMMWLTTMNPETRRLIKVEPEDVTKMETMFNLLLGNDEAGRKRHISEHGKEYLDQLDLQ